MIDRAVDGNDNPLTVGKLIGTDALETFARAIAAQHKPIAYNWAARFGLPGIPMEEVSSRLAKEHTIPPLLPNSVVLAAVREEIKPHADEVRKPKKKLICAICYEPVELKVARFCWFNKARFGENIYCMECQKSVH